MEKRKTKSELFCFTGAKGEVERGGSAYTTGWAIKIKIELISERQTAYTPTHIHLIIREIGRKANVVYWWLLFLGWPSSGLREQMKSGRADEQTNKTKIVNDYKRVSGDNEH